MMHQGELINAFTDAPQNSPRPAAPGPSSYVSDEALRFMFTVGIECSNPITTGNTRVDQLQLTGHYEHWQKDLRLVYDLGVRYLRYGPPIHKVFLGPGQFDWSFTDRVFAEMQRLRIKPIVDLVHFGLPDWLIDFQNPDWPAHVADYADAFARRYPWVRFYTPVNEMYVTAMFSGLYGWWNEQQMSDHAFVTNIKNSARASILMMRAILNSRPDAVFVFSESTEYVHPGTPQMVRKAQFMNERRFLALDLLLGHDVSASIFRYLLEAGMRLEEYEWFRAQTDLRGHCIMGTDYYITNEHVLMQDDRTIAAGDIYGYYVITRQYYDRYRLPIMHTETNRTAKVAVEWLWKEWMNLLRLREDGVPIIGFTWYGLVDMIDWDSALTRLRGHVNQVGLFSLERRERKVAKAFRELVQTYSKLPITNSKMLILTA